MSKILTHLAEDRSLYFGAIAPPIIQSSNFAFDTIASFRNAISNEMQHHVYTRGINPTVDILRKKIAALEHTEDCLILSSGAAAVSAAIVANVVQGDHVICVDKPYGWTYKLLAQLLEKFGVSCTFVDGREVSNIEKVIQPNTKVLFLESPNSITFELQDLAACAQLAKSHGITTIIDNSHCSPIYQNPADLGIDIIVHSATKYLCGHSDVVMGVICATQAMIQRIFDGPYMTFGLNVSPHDAALALRGLRTLPLRLERSNTTAMILAEYLHKHPKVSKIYYPHHSSFPQYELAKKQMRGSGGLLSFELATTSKESVIRFVDQLDAFLLAVSWGGYESLKMPTIAFYDMPGKPNPTIPFQTIRLYIGLEDVDFLKKSLDIAFDSILPN